MSAVGFKRLLSHALNVYDHDFYVQATFVFWGDLQTFVMYALV